MAGLVQSPSAIAGGWLAAVLVSAYACYHLLVVLAGRRYTRKIVRAGWRRGYGGLLYNAAAAARLAPRADGRAFQERRQMLRGCGVAIDPGVYMVWRGLLIAGGVAVLAYTYVYGWRWGGWPPMFAVPVCLAAALLVAACAADRPILEAYMRQRRNRMLADICVIHRQLLYYAGSPLNLHSKLVRCLPYAKSIRKELHLLTNEWYEYPDLAIRKFKERLGSEEGGGFAETLQSLRLHEHERYYELLRRRIADYKEKLELLKAGRKESLSYLLFVMAGIPIMYTFRLFIYPWVAEGQKLFDTLG